MKKILIFLILFSCGYAQCPKETTPPQNCFENSCSQIEPTAPLSSARECIQDKNNMGFISSLNFLYFQPKEDGLEFVAKNHLDANSPPSVLVDGSESPLNFDFGPGFKAGIGMFIPVTSWDMFMNWTQLYNNFKNSTHLDVNGFEGGLFPLFWKTGVFDNDTNAVIFSDASSNVHFYFNSLDLEVGDSFFVSKYISFRIHGGLRGAVIHQKFHINYDNGNLIENKAEETIQVLSGKSHFKSDAKGLGPRIGWDSIWNLANSNFNIIANGSISFLLTRFNMRYFEFDKGYNQTRHSDAVSEYKMHEYVWVIRPVTQLTVGFDWNKCFGQNRDYVLSLKAAYEIQFYYEQNLSRKLVDDEMQGMTYPNKGDLYLHGLLIAARFEF